MTYSKFLLPIIALGAFNACAPSAPQSGDATKPEVSDTVSPGCGIECLAGNDHIFEMKNMSEALIVPDTMGVETLNNSIRLSGRIAASSGYKTSGVAIELQPKFEREFHGRNITVTVIARSLDEPATRIGVAYSTNDQGNSGWTEFDLTSDYQAYSFEYDVPLMVAGGMDYIGFGPVSSSEIGSRIEVLAVGVSPN